jgi:ribose transport system permease protein
MSAGMTLVILAGGIDLSVAAVLALSACVAALQIAAGQVALGVVAGLGVGLACGVCTGTLVAYGRIPAFIASYGMLWIVQGIGYILMQGNVVHGFPASFRFVAVGFVGGVPALLLVGLGVLALLHIVLHSTVFGRGLYAIGGNPAAARLSGMPVRRHVVGVYALSGLLSAVAALAVIARVNAAEAGIGDELLLPAIAAVCLGGTSLFGGVGSVAGTAVGSLILALILNGINLLSVPTLWQNAVVGGIIVLSVLADQLGGARLLRQI